MTDVTTSDGVRLYAEATGSGLPVLFIHEFAADHRTWSRQVDALSGTFRCVTYASRGYPPSEVPPEQERYNYLRQADDAIDVLDAFGIARAHVVGLSMGGFCALQLGIRYPAMARDAIAFIRALGYDRVDLLGFSLGGFIAQAVVEEEPHLIRKLILAGTGPAGGAGIDKVTPITLLDTLKATLTRKDPKEYLFFTQTANGKATARQFVNRLKERTGNRDKPISVTAFRNQLKAIHEWGRQAPADLTVIQQPVLVANGDHDRMVPSGNSADLARRLPNARLELYPDAGHGGIFQYHDKFVDEALKFLDS